MPVIDSFTKTIRRDYTIEEVSRKAEEIRFSCLHDKRSPGMLLPGFTPGHIEIAAVLYFKFLQHDPACPLWDDRDWVFWSNRFPEFTIRTILEAVGYSSHVSESLLCSFVNPLGIAAGTALQAKIDGKENLVVCIMRDADLHSGGSWEAAEFALHYRLGNLIGVVVQSSTVPGSGCYRSRKSCFLADKYASFGWEVLLADSTDAGQFLQTLESVRRSVEKPTVIITDDCGNAQNGSDSPVSTLNKPTGIAQVFTERMMRQESLDLDCGLLTGLDSIMRSHESAELICSDEDALKGIGSRKNRSLFGVSPGNASEAAAGLALGGKLPFLWIDENSPAGSTGERVYSAICAENIAVKIVSVMSTDAAGRSQLPPHSFADLSVLHGLPGLHIEVPCDALQAERALLAAAERDGPGIIRCRWSRAPVLTRAASNFVCGIADILRYRRVSRKFEDSFESVPGYDYRHEGEPFCFVSIGTVLSDTMTAAYLLKEKHDIEARILNLHTLKPLDVESLERAVDEIGVFIIVEDHYTRGFGAIVAEALSRISTFHSSPDITIIYLNEEDLNSGIAAEMILVKAIEFLEFKEGREI